MIHVFPLFHRRQQVYRRIAAHRHVVEVPMENLTPFFYLRADKFVRGDLFDIGAGVADRSSEETAVLLQQVHGTHDLLIDTAASSLVVDLPRCPSRLMARYRLPTRFRSSQKA